MEKAPSTKGYSSQYLTGDYSYRQLGSKYGIDFRKFTLGK